MAKLTGYTTRDGIKVMTHQKNIVGYKSMDKFTKDFFTPEFYKDIVDWVHGQSGACMCLGNCEKCGYHVCHGCACWLIERFNAVLAQQKAMFVERIDNLPRHDILVDDMDAGYMGGVVYGYNLAKDDVIKAIQATNQEEEME